VVKLRVRVNSYTNVHAVAVLQDGRLVEDAKFVKASAAVRADGRKRRRGDKGMGEMRLKFPGAAIPAPRPRRR